MRVDWLPFSASAVVAGGTAFAVAVLTTPNIDTSPSAGLGVFEEDVWLAVSALYVLAGIALICGLPSVLSLLDRHQSRFGLVATTVFAMGALATVGYGAVLLFLHALVIQDALTVDSVEAITNDPGLTVFLVLWVGGFYLGQALIAIALLRARAVPRWVGLVLLGYLIALPIEQALPEAIGRLDVLLVAVGFAAVGIQANNHHLTAP